MVDLSTVVEELAAPIVLVSHSSRILLCNKAARLAFRLGETCAEHWSISEDLPALSQVLLQPQEACAPARNELTLPGGRKYIVQATPIEGIGLALLLQDAAVFNASHQAESEFLLQFSHDLRTPLTTIQGYVELLTQVGQLNEQQWSFIERVRASVKHITDLVRDAIELSRFEAARELSTEPCDLAEVIQMAVEQYLPQSTNNQRSLIWSHPNVPLTVAGNRASLRLVMSHLLSNAIRYTQPGGTIRVDASREADHIAVRVADDGIGIPLDQQPHIFERFFRVAPPETPEIKGTGLGLPLVKSVVERHHGRVWVESQPGEGSTFTFVLPVLAAQGASINGSALTKI